MSDIVVGIISFLGSPSVRESRWEMQWKQIQWLKEIDTFEKIRIIAMEWTEEEIEKVQAEDSRIEIIEMDKMPQGNARNVLLEQFYGSSRDWCLFLDNDAILYNNHMSGPDFFKELTECELKRLEHVDVILPIDPRQEPFTKEYEKNKRTIDANIVLKLFPGMKTSFFIMKNLRKHKGKKEFFNEEFVILEDYELACHLAYYGYGIYKSKNIVLKEFGTSISTLPYDENGGRKKLNDKWLGIIYDKWSVEADMTRTSLGKIQGAKFIRKWFANNNRSVKVIVPKKNSKAEPITKFF